jgi:hypothetical protein
MNKLLKYSKHIIFAIICLVLGYILYRNNVVEGQRSDGAVGTAEQSSVPLIRGGSTSPSLALLQLNR